MKYTLLALLMFTNIGWAQNSSQYTSIESTDCVVVSSSAESDMPEIDFYSMVCPSFAGYQVEISGGDIRYNLKLNYEGHAIKTEDAGGAFHDMAADKIEWRYKLIKGGVPWDNKVIYTALIYRMHYSNYSEDGPPTNDDMMVVIKLDGKNSCQTGRIKASEAKGNLNVLAREIADNPKATCL